MIDDSSRIKHRRFNLPKSGIKGDAFSQDGLKIFIYDHPIKREDDQLVYRYDILRKGFRKEGNTIPIASLTEINLVDNYKTKKDLATYIHREIRSSGISLDMDEIAPIEERLGLKRPERKAS
tara:strand:+ start:959 stop:1324 length:366 start_codon:yes stop_codon:yes gene_type:complete